MDETGELKPPELPEDPMEFLSRSWSASALEVAKAIGPRPPLAPVPVVIREDVTGEMEEAAAAAAAVSGNPFAFASSTTSLLVMERIMSQSEATPLASGRLSHSSGGPLNGGGSFSDSPPISPSNIDDDKYCRAGNTPKSQAYRGTCKTVGRWFKDKREKRNEDARAQNAQVHAAVSVAGVAAAVAAIAAATAAASGSGNDDRSARTDMAVAAAATLVAAQCVEAAEAMGAEREHLAAVVGSAVNVRTPGDIITLTAAAATALRGAATLKARTLKEVWSIAAVIPVEKGGMANHNSHCQGKQQKEWATNGGDEADDLVPQEENFLGLCSRELLAKGTELLKRTRNGALHWKIVSVYINRLGQVTLKMKSRHIARTITKKKKRTVIEVCKEIKPWPCRHLPEGGEQRRYFGLKTAEQRVIEFECQGQREFEMWTQGVSRLLNAINDRKAPRMNF